VNEITLIAIRRAKKEKRIYDTASILLMIGTMLSLMLTSNKISIVLVLLTMLALLSSNAIQTRIQIMENELADDTVSKYIDDE
jgi:hypothetical protein